MRTESYKKNEDKNKMIKLKNDKYNDSEKRKIILEKRRDMKRSMKKKNKRLRKKDCQKDEMKNKI